MLDDALKDQKKNANQQYAKLGKGLAAVAAIVLVLVIGKSFLGSPAQNESPDEELAIVSDSNNSEQNEQARESFRLALNDFEQKFSVAIESEALARWAPDELQEAQAVFEKALSDFAKSNYVDALENIELADELASTLVNKWDQAFLDLLGQAQSAFEQNESRKASLYLTQALTLKPDNEEALALEQRLAKLPDIEQLLEDARIAQTENSLEREAEAIRQIIQLDPVRTELVQRLKVLEEELKVSKYQQHISRGMTAIRDGRLGDANQALRQAKQLYPSRKEIGVLEREIASGNATNRRQNWQEEIKSLITQDNWAQVLKVAEEAKKVFPTDKNFIDSATLANDIVARSQRIDRYLSQPDRLKDDGIHANASAFAESTQSVAGNSLGLTLKLEQFNAVLETLAEPVSVVVKSDGKTDIIVIGTGKVGKTREKEITLKAGTYVFEGSRKGYRNVRVTFTVDPFAENQEVTVVCDEQI